MKKIILLICGILLSTNVNSQLSEDIIESIKGKPIKLIEDTYHQKKNETDFKTYKHSKYSAEFKNNKLQTQITIDTLGGTTPYHLKYDYLYNNDHITSITTKSLTGELKKTIKYYYDNNSFKTKEEEYNNLDDLVKTTTYSKSKCSESENSCVTSYMKNTFSKYKMVYEYNNKNQLIKKISYNRETEDEVSSIITYQYNGSGKLISEDKKLNSGRGFTTTYKYDEKGNLIHKKAKFVEFYYTYKYDNNGNWTERIETTKVKSKRIITRRSLTY